MLDPMLNIWHRGALMEMFRNETERALRHHSLLTAMMIDVDSFKQINDKHGHLAGDAVLREFSQRIKGQLRSYDIFGRYGGDEFMVIMPNISAEDAQARAQHILDSIMTIPVMVHGVQIHMAASIGLATADYKHDTPDAMELLKRADDSLLTAKRTGKGRAERHTASV